MNDPRIARYIDKNPDVLAFYGVTVDRLEVCDNGDLYIHAGGAYPAIVKGACESIA